MSIYRTARGRCKLQVWSHERRLTSGSFLGSRTYSFTYFDVIIPERLRILLFCKSPIQTHQEQLLLSCNTQGLGNDT